MKHARPDYDRIQDPLGLIPQDEPVFLLRSTDAAAPAIVDAWAGMAEGMGARKDIVEAARKQAQAMRVYQAQQGSHIPDLSFVGVDMAHGADASVTTMIRRDDGTCKIYCREDYN